MKNIFFLGCLILLGNYSYSQRLPDRPYSKVEFIDVEPQWRSEAFAPSMIRDSCNGYNGFFISQTIPVFRKDYIIRLFTTTYNADFGHYIDKININTGETIWKLVLDHTVLERQEYGCKMYLDSDENLILWSYRKEQKFSWNGPTYMYFDPFSRVAYRKINGKTGEVMEFNTPILGDSINTIVTGSLVRTAPFSDFIQTSNPKEIKYVSRITKADNNFLKEANMVTTIINSKGKYNKPLDTLKFGEKQYIYNLFQLSIDTLLYLEVDTLTRSKLTMRIMDGDLNTIKRITLDRFPQKIDYNWVSIYKYTKDYFIITGSELVEGTSYYNQVYAFYDYDGKLLRYCQYNDEEYDNVAVDYLPVRDKYLFIGRQFANDDDVSSLIVVNEINNQNKLARLKAIEVKDKLHAIGFRELKEIDRDRVLIDYIQIDWYLPVNSSFYRYDYFSKVFGYLMWDAKDLGLVPSSTHDDIATVDYRISPNPTSDVLYITFDVALQGRIMEMTDVSGRSVMIKELSMNTTQTLDLSGFSKGIYFIKVTDHKGRTQYEVKKVIVK